MISFIVTTYNLDHWLLRRCLHSIVSQGLPADRYEIIVVDDESAVAPLSVVNEFVGQANISLYIQQHARQGAARNLGLQHAKGEWVQFVDGDDYLFEGMVSLVLNAAHTNNLDLLLFGFREVRTDSPLTNVARAPYIAQGSIMTGNAYMLRHNLFGSCCTMLFRRQLLEDGSYGMPLRFTECIYIEDEEFVTKLVWRARRMAKVDLPVYAYYQRVGSTVHSRSAKHTDELFRNYFVVMRRLLDFEESVKSFPHDGVTRKIRFLAVDIFRRALREPDWRERWQQSACQLRAVGLFPLPPASYSIRYRIFRLLSQCGIGRLSLRFVENKTQK